MRWRRLLAPLALAAALLAARPALGADLPRLDAADYANRLEQAVARLPEAERWLPAQAVVVTPAGETPVDHREELRHIARVDGPGERARRDLLARAVAARAAAAAPDRGGEADQARLAATVAAMQVQESLLRQIGEWLLRRLLPGLAGGRAPGWVSIVLAAVTALVVLAAAVAFVAWAVRQRGSWAPGDAGAGPRPVVAGLVATDPAELLRAARAAAAGGDYREAVRRLYAGMLLHLDRRGQIRWQPWATNGHYARELSRVSPDLAPPFRQLTDLFETRWYGRTPASARDWAAAAGLALRLGAPPEEVGAGA